MTDFCFESFVVSSQEEIDETELVMREKVRMSDLYLLRKGEILWSCEETLMRRHFTEMFFLVKNESSGSEDD